MQPYPVRKNGRLTSWPCGAACSRRSANHSLIRSTIDMAKKNPYLGSTLESLLREDGTYEDAKN